MRRIQFFPKFQPSVLKTELGELRDIGSLKLHLFLLMKHKRKGYKREGKNKRMWSNKEGTVFLYFYLFVSVFWVLHEGTIWIVWSSTFLFRKLLDGSQGINNKRSPSYPKNWNKYTWWFETMQKPYPQVLISHQNITVLFLIANAAERAVNSAVI